MNFTKQTKNPRNSTNFDLKKRSLYHNGGKTRASMSYFILIFRLGRNNPSNGVPI